MLTLLTNPNAAFLLLIAGLLAIYVEFVRPGLVFPAVLGGMAAVLAVSSLLKDAAVGSHVDGAIAMWISIPFTALTLFLLRVAWKARANKLAKN